MKALVVALVIVGGACGGPELSADGFDGELDCPSSWSTVYDVPPDLEGAVTPFKAMEEWAGVYEDLEYSIHVDTARLGTVVIDGAEVVLIRVEELPTEMFAVVETSGCDGFEA